MARPTYSADLVLKPDLDQVDALAPEREALWSRLQATTFLTDDAGPLIASNRSAAPSFTPLERAASHQNNATA
jgi:phage portal protein BeeE